MSKVKITKAQAEFIEGFKRPHLWDNDKKVEIGKVLPIWAGQALHNLMQFGFGKGIEDVNGKVLSDDENDPEKNFQHDQVSKLIEAVMHGYEVEEKKVVLYIEFYDSGREEDRKVYFGTGSNVTNKEIATEYDLSIEWEAKKVEELKEQGWKVEEVK